MIGLVGCAATKLAQAAPARELYVSPLFRLALAFAEQRCTKVYILSALHELVDLDRVIEPYERRLGGKVERQAWGERVGRALVARHGREVDYLILAGADYANPVEVALRTHDGYRDGAWHGVAATRILQPLTGMKIGARLRYLSIAREPRGPRVRILRALRRFDWIAAADLLIALDVPDDRNEHNRFTAALGRLVEEGLVEIMWLSRPRLYRLVPGRDIRAEVTPPDITEVLR
ncbi:MAG TPA: hypothetical protein VN253_07775 [Kofleriaceae bacterium]|nr:hypothetical protein [Kofleriaceae bacterium]